MKTMMLMSALMLATACVQREPVRVKATPPLESNTLVDIPELEEAPQEMNGFLCDMSSDNGLERVFLQFTKKVSGERRLHIRKLQGADSVEPFYPIIGAYRILPVKLKTDSFEKVTYSGEAEIIDTLTAEGLKMHSASGQVVLNREGDSFSGHINIAFDSKKKDGSIKHAGTLVIAELEKCIGPETVKMGTK